MRTLLSLLASCLLLPSPALAHSPLERIKLEDGALLSHHTDKPLPSALPLTQARLRSLSSLDNRLASQHCGQSTAADRLPNPSAAYFKMVYAQLPGQPDRYAQWASILQRNVRLINDYLLARTGGERALNFDLGTECGSQYLDIAHLRLPALASGYLNNLGLIRAQVSALLRLGAGAPSNLFVLVDRGGANNAVHGEGEFFLSSSPAGSLHRSGGLVSAVWTPANDLPGLQRDGAYFPELILHELLHNLGAVQADAPHATRLGHCTDERDVMCYQDSPTSVLQQKCAPLSGVIEEQLDCGGDDYFNLSPSPGSYLSQHWNLADSPFLSGASSPPSTPASTPPEGNGSSLTQRALTLTLRDRRGRKLAGLRLAFSASGAKLRVQPSGKKARVRVCLARVGGPRGCRYLPLKRGVARLFGISLPAQLSVRVRAGGRSAARSFLLQPGS